MSPNNDGVSNSAENVCVHRDSLTRDETLFEVSSPIVDLPISRSGISADDFTIIMSKEYAQAQESDTELQLLRDWITAKQCPSANDLAPLSGRMKALAQLFDQILLHD